MPEKLYRLIGPTVPTHPQLGQRVLAAGPNLAELENLGRSIITRSYALAPYLHVVETTADDPLDTNTIIYVPTVLNLEPEILIFWSEIEDVFGRSSRN